MCVCVCVCVFVCVVYCIRYWYTYHYLDLLPTSIHSPTYVHSSTRLQKYWMALLILKLPTCTLSVSVNIQCTVPCSACITYLHASYCVELPCEIHLYVCDIVFTLLNLSTMLCSTCCIYTILCMYPFHRSHNVRMK